MAGVNRWAALALAAAGALAVAAPGGAGRPGAWTKISDGKQANIDQVGLARTADGVLHVAWRRETGATNDLVHTAISPAGAVGATTPILTGWSGTTNVTLVVQGDGSLRALFSGLRSTDVHDPYTSGTVYSATASGSGSGWTLAGPGAARSSAYASDVIGSAIASDGTIVTDWASTFGTITHVGLDPAAPNAELQGPCCGYQTAVAADAVTGDVYAAWYSNAREGQGTYVEKVKPSGPKLLAPGSVTTFGGQPGSLGADQITAIAGRKGGAGGVYVAYLAGYPTAKTVDLWAVGTAKPVAAVAASGATHVALGQGPEGRLWLMWARNGRIYAARTNRAATRVGTPVAVAPPPSTGTIFKTAGEGSLGPLDLLTLVQLDDGSHSTWHTQVLPRLTVAVSRSAKQVVVRVTDVGDPVAGASVSLGGKRVATDAQGRATFAISASPAQVRVAKAGYVAASARLR
jgi:hypothetical protein